MAARKKANVIQTSVEKKRAAARVAVTPQPKQLLSDLRTLVEIYGVKDRCTSRIQSHDCKEIVLKGQFVEVTTKQGDVICIPLSNVASFKRQ